MRMSHDLNKPLHTSRSSTHKRNNGYKLRASFAGNSFFNGYTENSPFSPFSHPSSRRSLATNFQRNDFWDSLRIVDGIQKTAINKLQHNNNPRNACPETIYMYSSCNVWSGQFRIPNFHCINCIHRAAK